MEEETINKPEILKIDTDVKVFAALSYLSILFVVPWIIKKEDKFVMFHVKQGLSLFLIEIIAWFILLLLESLLTAIFSFGALTFIDFLYMVAWIGFAALSIIGIYYAVKGQRKELPVISIFSRNLKI